MISGTIKVGDYSLKIHKSAYHLFSVFISRRSFSSMQTRETFGTIISITNSIKICIIIT